MNYWGYGCDNLGLGILGGVFSLIFWILVVVIVIYFVRWLLRGDKIHIKGITKDSPLDILKERYVKGEIDKKEYEEKKKDLMG